MVVTKRQQYPFTRYERMILMKNVIGFTDIDEENTTVTTAAPSAPAQIREPFCCIAKIRFGGKGMALDYYNDEFYLEPGDKVFVSGAHYGETGTVESVTTHFRIDKSKYKKVIAKPDLHITGSFIPVNDKMVSFDTNFDADRFASVMFPPADPESDSQDEEIICGEGWSIDLADFEESENVNPSKLQPGLDYCTGGKVLYLSLTGGKGAAFIRGKNLYKTEFEFDGETLSELYCTCPFNDDCLCKHEIAVLITLRMLLGRPELEGKTDFTAFDARFFWNYASAESDEILLK